MQNTTRSYALPSPQSGTDFSLSILTASPDVQVLANAATMYVQFQGPAPQTYVQKFRWIPVGQSWEDTTSTELVNMLTICTFNFGSYALCMVQTL